VEALQEGFEGQLPALLDHCQATVEHYRVIVDDTSFADKVRMYVREEGEDSDSDSDEDDEDEDVSARKEREQKQVDQLDEQLFALCYGSLNILEKCAKFLPTPTFRHMEGYFGSLIQCCVSTHTWVRHAASRVVGLYFAHLGEAPQSSEELQDTMMQSYENVFFLCKQFCEQLGSNFLDAALGEQIVKNTAFVLKILASAPDFYFEIEGEEVEEGKRKKNRSLNWLFQRVSHMARNAMSSSHEKHSGTLQVLFTLRLFAFAFNALPVDQMKMYLPHVLHPVHRVLEEAQGSVDGQAKDKHADEKQDSKRLEVQTFAHELLEFLKGKFEASHFLEVYRTVTDEIGRKRQSRKRDRQTLAVRDPELHAKKKIKKNMLKKGARARRVTSMRIKHDRRDRGAHTPHQGRN
jgi:U3 small nucleolar RNA-associated protein 20